MAKQIPIYDATTNITPAHMPESKGFDAWSKDFEHLTKQIDSMRKQDVDFDTIQQAKIAGSQPDFEEEEPKTREDKIFERQALKSNQIALSNQVRTQALQLRSELTAPGNLNANSGDQFRAQMNQYLGTVIDAAPEANKEYIKNMGDRYISSIGSMVDLKANSLSKSQLRFSLYSFVDGQMQMAQNSALHGSAAGALDTAALYGQISDKIDSAVMAGYMPAAQASSMLKRSKEQLQIYSVLGKFKNDMKNGDAESSLMQFIQNPPADMSLESYKQALSMMHGMLQTQQSIDNINTNMIKQQTIETFNAVASGQLDAASPEVGEAYQNAKSQGEESAKEFNGGLNKASNKAALMNSTQFITPMQADATANMLVSKLNPDSKNYQTQIDAINDARLAVYQNYQKFKADPASIAMKSPMVQQAIQAANTEPQVPFKSGGITAGDQFLNADITKAMIAQEKAMGAVENPTNSHQPQLSLIPKATARNLSTALNSMSVEDQVGKLQALQKKDPQNFNILLRDLHNGGFTIGNQFFFTLSQVNPASQFDALNALRMTDKDTKTIPDKQRSQVQTYVNQNLSDFNASLNNYALPSTALLQANNETINRLANYYLFSGKTTSAKQAAKMAYDAYITPVWNLTNPDGRSPLRIPKNMSASQIKDALDYVKNTDIKKGTVFYNNHQPVDNPEGYMQAVLYNGKWVNMPDNSGVILTDQYGQPVERMIDGRLTLVGVKFKDILNDNSAINQKISEIQMNRDKALYANVGRVR